MSNTQGLCPVLKCFHVIFVKNMSLYEDSFCPEIFVEVLQTISKIKTLHRDYALKHLMFCCRLVSIQTDFFYKLKCFEQFLKRMVCGIALPSHIRFVIIGSVVKEMRVLTTNDTREKKDRQTPDYHTNLML